jgi:CheY-like chemotaxis protein
LEILQKESFDLALFDVMMPQLTGYDLTRKIREEIDYSELPILLLTAKSQPSDVQVGFECGASDYLVKPFARQELLARIGTHQKVHLQGLALKKATKDLQNEIKAKTFLVQDLLHRGNNPLHACQLQLETLAVTKKSLESILLSLFNHDSGLDEEAHKCLMQIKSYLAQLEESVRFAHLQTHRISGALEEIRSLSGIDGITSQSISLKDLMDRTLDRLKEQLPQHTFALLKVEWALDPTLKIPGHPTVFPVILERFIRQILLEAPSSLTLTWILKQEIPHLEMNLGDSREPWHPSPQSEELLLHISYCLRSLGFELKQTEQPHILRLAA